MSETKKRVIFVDDEPKVLDGLRRMLRKLRDEWDMEFALSGREALEAMARQPFDVVVSDMRMPEMDGAQLLNTVKERYPGTVRLILSGHSDKEMILRSVGPTHQYLAKPCDADTLKETVIRAYALRDLLESDDLKTIVAGIDTLPSLPTLYTKLVEVLQSPESSVQEVAEIISSDIGMTAKVLQLVNSAFFGLRRHIESPAQAISYLGLDTIQAIVLTAGAFAELGDNREALETAETLYPHSVKVGALAGTVARSVSDDKRLIDDSVMAGMLHDIGKLVFVAKLPNVWREANKMARDDTLAIQDAEQAVSGVTHAELGGYLIGLWGLPNPIVEAVAFHHGPKACLSQAFSVLTAVHVANGLVIGTEAAADGANAGVLDTEYLEELGVADRVPEWRALAEESAEQETADAGHSA
jgi:HD-like signal output (HDOD) protein/ActR/RegA family two-component response regulator